MTTPASALSGLWPYAGRHDECPNRAKHRGPEGPNEDISQCGGCGHVSYDMRPPGETWGWHDDDCSLPVDHESYCKPGGSGHDPAPEIRGYWPHDPRSEDFRPVDNAPKHEPHGVCVGIPLPPLESETLTDQSEGGQG